MNILFVAVENGIFDGGKVGGIGDVIHYLPPSLADRNCRMTIVIPSHGFLHQQAGAVRIHTIKFFFRGLQHSADIYQVFPATNHPNVTQLVIHHPELRAFDSNRGRFHLYTDDSPDRPFSSDASRFAFFSAAVSATVCSKFLDNIDCIHLHDWHTAFVALLREFDPEYAGLKNIRLIYSIHNLALQGVRPLRYHESSLEAWFPELNYNWSAVADPRWPDCFNAMAAGIRLADIVHTVSPSYAAEIQKPSRKPQFFGGEGLEGDLLQAGSDGRLIGILNGCHYPPIISDESFEFQNMLDLFRSKAIDWSGSWDMVPASQFITYARALELDRRSNFPQILLTSVSRIVDQKVLLLRESGSDGKSGLQGILDVIGDTGCYLLLGNGDRNYEKFFTEMSSQFDNFLFINGYSDRCADALYRGGDLFIMPSSYEPCGLGQMIALRHGQPCVVHKVGGLKDTVRNGHNGFTFEGEDIHEQVDALVFAVSEAVAMKQNRPGTWHNICEKAAASRYSWHDSAGQYIDKLYRPD